MTKTVGIITSDPNSINYEIIKKSLFFFKKKNKNKYLFIGSKKLFNENVSSNINTIQIVDISYKNKKNYLKNSFDVAFQLIKNKKIDILINLPLNKKKFFNNQYPGVTEYISKEFNTYGKETMLLYSNEFSVSPVTTHIKIDEVVEKYSKKKLINNIKNIHKFYKQIIKIKNPKIGILGFNPHNGLDLKGNIMERKILIPLINLHNKNNKNIIIGPISPDSSFLIREKKKINSLIGHYHDQVLTTFKYIKKFSAINITLGLPFFRISPDHGTGEDIIGQNKANPESFIQALKFCEKYYKNLWKKNLVKIF